MSDLRCEYCRRNQSVKAVENDFCEHTGLTYEELVSQLSTYKEALEKANKILIPAKDDTCLQMVGCDQCGPCIIRKALKALTPVQSPDAREKETR